MTIRMNRTLRTMLVATVASSLLLAACSSKSADEQQARLSGELRPPQNNPAAGANGAMASNMEGLRAPQSNPTAEVGAEYKAVTSQQQPAMMPQAEEEKPGLFSWMWDKPKPQIDTSQRRVPALNQNAVEQPNAVATASYEPAAPVQDVDMAAMAPAENGVAAGYEADGAWMEPQKDIIIAEDVVVMDEPVAPMVAAEPKTYPSLASVPLRPEGLDAIKEKDARMADLENARAESEAQSGNLGAQMASDMGEQSDLDAEFAALVASPENTIPESAAMQPEGAVMQGEEVQVVQEQAPAVVVSQGNQQPVLEPGQWQAVTPVEGDKKRPVMQNWEPVPMGEPQMVMTQPQPMQPVQPIQEDQWVSLQQDPAAQMAVPVEGVAIGAMPQVAAVSPVPVMPADNASAGIQLVPPSTYGATVRTLPESRYAARRQAVYMQRYSRQVD